MRESHEKAKPLVYLKPKHRLSLEFEALFQELESTLMDQHTTEVIDALNALELGLQDLGLWSDARPEPEALASTMPFCYDTLELEQWLQFIFLGRMREILEQGDRLPESCAIIPMLRCCQALESRFIRR